MLVFGGKKRICKVFHKLKKEKEKFQDRFQIYTKNKQTNKKVHLTFPLYVLPKSVDTLVFPVSIK